MGNVIAAHQPNKEFWNDPNKPTVFGAFIEKTLKNTYKLQLENRACCLGQVGRNDDHSGLKVSIANIGADANDPKIRSSKSSSVARAAKLGNKFGTHQLFLKHKTSTGDDYFDSTTDRLNDTHINSGNKYEFFTPSATAKSALQNRGKHVFNDPSYNVDPDVNQFYSNDYEGKSETPYQPSSIGATAENDQTVSEKFIEANKLRSIGIGTNGDFKIVNNMDSYARVAQLPEVFGPAGFVVKKVRFHNDNFEQLCETFDPTTDEGKTACDFFYKGFCEDKIKYTLTSTPTAGSDEVSCLTTSGNLDNSGACVVNRNQPGMLAEDVGRTMLFTYPEDCSCLNSQDSALLNSDESPLGKSLTELYETLTSTTTSADAVDEFTAQPSSDPTRHPLKTDQYCKDRSKLDYKEINKELGEYSQPAYVLSTDREAYNIDVNYQSRSATEDAPPPVPAGEASETTSTEASDVPQIERQGYSGSTRGATTYETDYVSIQDEVEYPVDTETMFDKYKYHIAGGGGILACVLVLYFVTKKRAPSQNFNY